MKGSTNANVQLSYPTYSVGISVASGVSGVTIYHAYGIKIGRTVQIDILFYNSTALSNVDVFKLSSTSSLVPALASVGIHTMMYNQSTSTTGTHKTMWVMNRNGEVYLNVASDGQLPASNTWNISFTYLTSE